MEADIEDSQLSKKKKKADNVATPHALYLSTDSPASIIYIKKLIIYNLHLLSFLPSMTMRNPGETAFSANSPPIFLELKMSEQLEMDPDFEFFDSTALDSANSPSQFVDDMGPDTTSQFLSNLLSPKNQNHFERSRTLENNCQSSLPTPQMESPAGSYQDSSSESSDYPRKSSSASLTSGLTPADILMGDDTALMGGWNNILGGDENIKLQSITDGCINPSAVNTSFLSNESSFDQDLSFGSSASSPSFKTGVLGMESPEISNVKARTPTKQIAMLNNFKSEKTTSVGYNMTVASCYAN